MKNILNILDIIIGNINRYIAAIGISAGVALAFVNVVARYGFNYSITWASELTVYFFLWSAFFGAAYCFKVDAHISINILLEKLKAKTAKKLMILAHIITVVFLSAVAYYGYGYLELVIELDERSVDLDIPMWIPYLVIPISFAFGAFRVFEKILDIFKTPADKVLQQSEAEMILEEMGRIGNLVKDVERKTGGML
jgi:C4-dicarboxylate transporter DctQ subunit